MGTFSHAEYEEYLKLKAAEEHREKEQRLTERNKVTMQDLCDVCGKPLPHHPDHWLP